MLADCGSGHLNALPICSLHIQQIHLSRSRISSSVMPSHVAETTSLRLRAAAFLPAPFPPFPERHSRQVLPGSGNSRSLEARESSLAR